MLKLIFDYAETNFTVPKTVFVVLKLIFDCAETNFAVLKLILLY